MSPRQLQRRFTEEIGIPPGSYVERVRVEAARRALAEGPEPLQSIARRCGFGTGEFPEGTAPAARSPTRS